MSHSQHLCICLYVEDYVTMQKGMEGVTLEVSDWRYNHGEGGYK